MKWPRGPRLPERLPKGSSLIEARGVGVKFGGFPVLSNVDFVAHAGEVVALVGPNGAGKSTLLGVLTGDIEATTGSVVVDGGDLSSWNHTELAMRRAVLPQHVLVTFPFTVYDVVRMGRAPWFNTAASDRDEEVISKALAEVEATVLAARQFPSLSGGERARVALARVLSQETQILLLDEPTAALDIHHQEIVLGLMRERATRGDGVVVVLHDLALAAAYADRVVVLAGGHIVADGDPKAVLRSELLSSGYQHEIEVIEHPRTGEVIILPVRSEGAARPKPEDAAQASLAAAPSTAGQR